MNCEYAEFGFVVHISMSSIRSTISEGTKYQILVRQSFRCNGISEYICPQQGRLFDESGYDIDHRIPLCRGGSSAMENLQALCPCCHRVKTLRENRERSKRNACPQTCELRLCRNRAMSACPVQKHITAFLTYKKWYLVPYDSTAKQTTFSHLWKDIEVWQDTVAKESKKKTLIRKVIHDRCMILPSSDVVYIKTE